MIKEINHLTALVFSYLHCYISC